jgi:hypothetical protein
MGDPGAIIAALLLKGNQAAHEAAHAERTICEQRMEHEQDEQLAQLEERASRIFTTGLATGLFKAGSGALGYAAARSNDASATCGTDAKNMTANAGTESELGAASPEGWESTHFDAAARLQVGGDALRAQSQALHALHEGCDLAAKLSSAGSDFVKASGESLEAENDVNAKAHERAATHAGRSVDDAKDKLAQGEKFARDVLDFVREFERTLDTARAAALHRS